MLFFLSLFSFVSLFLFFFFCEAMYSRLLKVEPVMVIKWEYNFKANWKNAKSKVDTSYTSPIVWPSPFGTIWVHEDIKRFITVLIFFF